MGPMGPMGMMPGMPMMPNAPYMYPPMPRPEIEPVAQPPVAPLPTDKETLGEFLYPMVELKDKDNAAKITGILLEMKVEQIHNIIRNPNQLDKWIVEANKVLNSNAAAPST